MTVQAYVLIQTDVGRAPAVATAVRAISGVDASDIVTGPYDVIVRATTDSIDELGRMVVHEIQLVEGVAQTRTCPILSLD